MLKEIYKTSTAVQLWILSLVLFFGATLFIVIIDFIGDRWFQVSWARGPDLFPNMVLGYPLLFLQLFSVAALYASGIKIYRRYGNIKGVALGVSSVLLTGVISFIFYIVFAFWYQFSFMGRPM
jgi:hypothetical protein